MKRLAIYLIMLASAGNIFAQQTGGGGGAGTGATSGGAVAGAYGTQGYASGTVAVTAAATTCYSLLIPNAFTAGHIALGVTSSDTTHNVDFGIYNHAGTLVAHTGALLLSGQTFFSFAGGTQTIPAGEDYFCATGATGLTATTLNTYQNQLVNFPWTNVSSATSGGALNSTISTPADSITNNTNTVTLNIY